LIPFSSIRVKNEDAEQFADGKEVLSGVCLKIISKLLHDRIGDFIRAMGLEGPVEEGENIVAVALFDDQIPIHSSGDQGLKLGALFRVHSGAADEEVDDFSGDGHTNVKMEEGRWKQKKTCLALGGGPSVVCRLYAHLIMSLLGGKKKKTISRRTRR